MSVLLPLLAGAAWAAGPRCDEVFDRPDRADEAGWAVGPGWNCSMTCDSNCTAWCGAGAAVRAGAGEETAWGADTRLLLLLLLPCLLITCVALELLLKCSTRPRHTDQQSASEPLATIAPTVATLWSVKYY